MMLYNQSSTDHGSSSAILDHPAHSNPVVLRAAYRPPVRSKTEYSWKRPYISLEGGSVLIRLLGDSRLSVEKASMECELLGWGIKFPRSEVVNLPKMMARRFLELFSKADSGSLTEQEEASWLQVVDRVDYAAFCSDRAAPHYLEGILISRNGPRARVEWHTGETEKLNSRASAALDCLNPGDRFSCFAKLDRSGEAAYLERIALLSCDV